MKILFQAVDSVLDEVDAIERRITDRASALFRERGGAIGDALGDWLKAERQTVWRPAIEVVRTRDAFVVEAAVAGVNPKRLDIRVSPTELLITAELHHSDREQEGDVLLCEFDGGPLFRSYRFPAPIDPARTSAAYENGMLRVTAPLAGPAARVEVKVA